MPNTPVTVNSYRKPQTYIGYENSINHLLINNFSPVKVAKLLSIMIHTSITSMMGASLNTTLSKLLVYLHNLTVFKNVELWIKHF